MKIEIRFANLRAQGFGAYVKDSAKKGTAQVLLDVNCIASCCQANDIRFKEMTSETILHEIYHAIEDLYDQTFNDDLIESMIEAFRKPLDDCSDPRLHYRKDGE